MMHFHHDWAQNTKQTEISPLHCLTHLETQSHTSPDHHQAAWARETTIVKANTPYCCCCFSKNEQKWKNSLTAKKIHQYVYSTNVHEVSIRCQQQKNSTSRFTVQMYTRCQWGVNNHMNLTFYIQNLSTFSTQGQKRIRTFCTVPTRTYIIKNLRKFTKNGLLQGLTNFNWDQLSPTSTWTKTSTRTN
jgi:hypothetical protein